MNTSACESDILFESDEIPRVADIKRSERVAGQNGRPNPLVRFVYELQRRRVCRAATIYAVTLWLIAQIIDLISAGFGLPDWTVRTVVVLGLAGFPIALILSWLFDITPDGAKESQAVTGTDSSSRKPCDQVIDCSLLFIAMVIGAQLAFGAIHPAAADDQPVRRISVKAFQGASGEGAESFAVGLTTEVQHRLVSRGDTEVVSPESSGFRPAWFLMNGTVTLDDQVIRVTVTIANGESGTIFWSRIFERNRVGTLNDQEVIGHLISQAIGNADRPEA